ncbi:MAG: SGNH/GDSL hydrolase family protein [Christensenellales bacterium]
MTKKGKKTTIISVAVVAIIITLVLLGLILTGYYVTWGPFGQLANIRFGKMEGNGTKYSVDNVQTLENSPLEGMNICYLGSSVTYGASSLQESFVEFIAKRNGTTYVKEAVSGTTLVTNGAGGASYVSRLNRLDKNVKFDLFICQLSTNDASQEKPIGNVYDSDTTTVCGAINYIIDYVDETWGCPMFFYTNAYYEDTRYANMVTALNQIAAVKGIIVIDLYNDEKFNDITDEQRTLYMADKIHPTKAGYLEWWTPKMEEYLYLCVR